MRATEPPRLTFPAPPAPGPRPWTGPGATLFEVDRLEPVIETLSARGVTFEDYDVPGLKTVHHIAWIDPERAA